MKKSLLKLLFALVTMLFFISIMSIVVSAVSQNIVYVNKKAGILSYNGSIEMVLLSWITSLLFSAEKAINRLLENHLMSQRMWDLLASGLQYIVDHLPIMA